MMQGSWNVKASTKLVAQLGRQRQWQQAVQVLEDACRVRVDVDHILLSTAVTACGLPAAWESILALLQQTEDALRLTTSLCNSGMDSLVKAGCWRWAMHLFQQMNHADVRKSVISYSSAIKAVAAGQQWSAASALLQDLRDSSLRCDTILCGSVMTACARAGCWEVALGLHEDMSTLSVPTDALVLDALIRSCEPGGKWAVAMRLLESLPDLGILPDLRLYNTVLGVCSAAGQWQRGAELLERACAAELEPDAFSFSVCVTACERATRWEGALASLREMRRVRVEPNEVTFNAAIRACEAFPEKAMGLLAEMGAASVSKSIITVNAALHALSVEGEGERWAQALSLLAEVEKRGLRLDSITLAAALGALECRWELALALLAQCLERSWMPHGLHVGSVLKAMSEESCWERSLDLLRDFYQFWARASQEKSRSMPDPDYKTRHEFTGSGLEPRELEALLPTLPLLFEGEGEGLVAVAKPAGISSEKALEVMAASLSKPLFSVSRLDLPTSGVLPAALGAEQSPEARWYLAQFAAHSLVEKTYLCLCQTNAVGAEGSVELPLKVVATSRSSSRAVPSPEGKRARTDFAVLAVFADATSQLSLLEARPRTGRLHQIRAHLASQGAPLVGDHLYGAQRVSWCSRLFLHCQRLKLYGPSREVHLEAPLPPELREALLGLRLLQGRFPS
ncbi:unnamed protein product [Symbiodinium sp. CCMP2592]|nr:unnamed protein product [Symbiodinium sp. CCMP2592]